MKEALKLLDLKIASLERELASLRALREEATKPPFQTIEELREYLDKHPPKRKAEKKLSIQEIDDELDIIRGVKPTPPGYVIDPSRMKELMKMRRATAAGAAV